MPKFRRYDFSEQGTAIESENGAFVSYDTIKSLLERIEHVEAKLASINIEQVRIALEPFAVEAMAFEGADPSELIIPPLSDELPGVTIGQLLAARRTFDRLSYVSTEEQ